LKYLHFNGDIFGQCAIKALISVEKQKEVFQYALGTQRLRT